MAKSRIPQEGKTQKSSISEIMELYQNLRSKDKAVIESCVDRFLSASSCKRKA